MSSFIMQPESIRDLACFINSVNVGGFNAHGFEPPQLLRQEFPTSKMSSVKDTYEKLYDMNAQAVHFRYPKDKKDKVIPPMPDGDFYVRPEIGASLRGGIFRKPTDRHYQILKRLNCFLYQCDEGEVTETDAYKALRGLERQLMMMIVTSTEAYQNAEWG